MSLNQTIRLRMVSTGTAILNAQRLMAFLKSLVLRYKVSNLNGITRAMQYQYAN